MEYETSEFLYELVDGSALHIVVKVTDLETGETISEIIDGETALFYKDAWWTEQGFADLCESVLE